MPLKLIYLHEPDIQVSYYLHLPSFKLHHKYIIVFIVVIQKYFLCFVFDHQSVFERVIRQEPVGLMTRILFSRYHFRILDSFGWNFRHAHFHEEGRRTLYKAFGIKFVIIVQGRAGDIGKISQPRL